MDNRIISIFCVCVNTIVYSELGIGTNIYTIRTMVSAKTPWTTPSHVRKGSLKCRRFDRLFGITLNYFTHSGLIRIWYKPLSKAVCSILYSACVLGGVCILLKSTGEGEWGRSGRFVCSLQENVSSFSTLFLHARGSLIMFIFIRALYVKLSFQNNSNPLVPESHSRKHTFCCLIQERVHGPAYTPIIVHGTISNLL